MTREEWLTILKKVITDIDGLEWEKGMNGLTTTIRLNWNEAVSLYELVKGRPKGEWVSRSGCYGVAYCSECNYELRVNNTNFCPNCGSDNRERSE